MAWDDVKHDGDVLHSSDWNNMVSDQKDCVHALVTKTIVAVHTFNPAAPGPPFIMGVNASGQVVDGLEIGKVDGGSA